MSIRTFFSLLGILCTMTAHAFGSGCDVTTLPLLTTPAQNVSTVEYKRWLEEKEQSLAEILLIGDSMMRRWPADLTEQAFGRKVANYGIDGDRLQNVLARLSEIRALQPSPRLVVLWVGTNNVAGRDVPCVVAMGISHLIADVRSLWPEARLLVLDIFPRGKELLEFQVARNVVNSALYAGQMTGGYRLLSFGDDLLCSRTKFGASKKSIQLENPNSFSCSNFQADNIHLSVDGYNALTVGLERVGPF